MTIEPTIEHRAEQPCLSIAAEVTMDSLGAVLPPLTGEVLGWLAERGITPAGPPYFQYLVIDMARTLQMRVGVPVATAVEGDGRVEAGPLPAGNYATVTHVGHPAELESVTADLLAWAELAGVSWDSTPTPAGERWGARLEIYHSDPAVEPDMSKWSTTLAFRTAD